MSKGLAGLVALLAFGLAAGLGAQSAVDYLNGVPYVWPSAQGSADDILSADDAAGTLDWATPPSSEGLWSGCVVLSTVSCPSGWTRVSGPDARVLRGAASWGTTNGTADHEHGLTGIANASTVGVSGSAASSGWSVSGSAATASASHGHGYSSNTTGGNSPGSPPAGGAATSISINSADPSHSHGDGTLAGASHGHGDGSLAGGSHGHAVGTLDDPTAVNVPAHYHLIVCEKD